MFSKEKLGQAGQEFLALISGSIMSLPGGMNEHVMSAVAFVPEFIPKDILREADGDADKAALLLGVCSTNPNVALPVQYIYSCALWRAADKEGLHGFLFMEAGEFACALLFTFAGASMNSKNYQQILWAGAGLVDIGESLRNFYHQTLGHIFVGYAYYRLGDSASALTYFRKGLTLLPRAEVEKANHAKYLENLHKWAEVARQLVGQLST